MNTFALKGIALDLCVFRQDIAVCSDEEYVLWNLHREVLGLLRQWQASASDWTRGGLPVILAAGGLASLRTFTDPADPELARMDSVILLGADSHKWDEAAWEAVVPVGGEIVRL